MTAPTLDVEPACPGPVETPDRPARAHTAAPALRAERRPFAEIPRDTWDRLAARQPWATPFSGWAFHQAWWDAYGANAHEETLVVMPADGPVSGPADEIVAIVPLMHRHAVEASDAETHTTMRHGTHADLTPVPPTAKAVFFGASYHADYATILADPADLSAVAAALADYFAGPDCGDWDAVDLRRLRCGDPAADAMAAAFGVREIAEGWTLNVEREDVCPVATFPEGVDMEGFLATLGSRVRFRL